ncbi:MAG: hypothetical protein IJ856_03285 [Candidatus Methanomethylophilaceae archaeon]|nr:hypothetical protein [Candidatus Methanomethylophilaceae archaeon]
MISERIGDCRIDILPVVNGLVTEADKVTDAYGGYEAYAASMGFEGIEGIAHRGEIEDDFGVNELDIAYAKHLEKFGQVEMPSPAVCRLVDLCAKDGLKVIPLDMNDEEYSEAYIQCVKTLEFVKEHRVAKKGYRHTFQSPGPEELARDWDAFVNSHIKGYGRLAETREKFIANQLKDTARFRKSVLAVIEVERVEGVLKALRETE